jgi:hypothetical protein
MTDNATAARLRREFYLAKAQKVRDRPGLKYSFTENGKIRFGFASGSCKRQIRDAVLKAHPDATFIPSGSHLPRSSQSLKSDRPLQAAHKRH